MQAIALKATASVGDHRSDPLRCATIRTPVVPATLAATTRGPFERTGVNGERGFAVLVRTAEDGEGFGFAFGLLRVAGGGCRPVPVQPPVADAVKPRKSLSPPTVVCPARCPAIASGLLRRRGPALLSRMAR